MDQSRRSFLRVGGMMGLAALVTGRLSSVAFGQSASESLGTGLGTVIPKEALGDPLYNITRAMFTQNLKTKFIIGQGGVKLTESRLVAVQDLNPPNYKSAGTGVRDCFSLVFREGGNLDLRQGTYTVQHAKLGTFDLFIVPGDNTLLGRQYTAVINRLYP